MENKRNQCERHKDLVTNVDALCTCSGTKSTRELALKWWSSLKYPTNKEYFVDKYFKNRHFTSLTGREIEEIWRKETQEGSDREIIEHVFPDLKPNQKQFKKFNPELFKSYINKFSDEDKLKARRLIESSIPQNLLIEDELKRLEEN